MKRHLLFIVRNPTSPQPIRLQAECTLDDVLTIVPRHVATVRNSFQSAVYRRVLDVFVQQIVLDSSPPGATSSMNMERCRMGLETPHQILQASGHTLLICWETNFEVLGERLSACCRTTVRTVVPRHAARAPAAAWEPVGEGLLFGYQDRVLVQDAYVRCVCSALAGHLQLYISTLGQAG